MHQVFIKSHKKVFLIFKDGGEEAFSKNNLRKKYGIFSLNQIKKLNDLFSKVINYLFFYLKKIIFLCRTPIRAQMILKI